MPIFLNLLWLGLYQKWWTGYHDSPLNNWRQDKIPKEAEEEVAEEKAAGEDELPPPAEGAIAPPAEDERADAEADNAMVDIDV